MIKGIKFTLLFLLLSLPAYAQTASILPLGRTQYFDNNGNPLSGGKVYNYIPGTTTFKTTWQDSAEAIANTNPVILDAAGRALIYGEGTYRQIVRKADNTLVWDAVTSATGSGGGSAGTGDGDLVGTIKPWAGITAPNQYAFAFGQELSRTTYSVLLTAITLTANVICTSTSNTLTGIADTSTINVGADIEVLCMPAGTTVVSKTGSTVVASNPATLSINTSAIFFPFGNGDGSTTFNVPDLRGYVVAGRCNMGGVSCSNLTTTYFGSNTPSAQGATGGSQNNSITIAQGNLPAVTLTTSIASGQGSHTHTYHSTAGNLDSSGGTGYTTSTGSGSVTDSNTLPAMTGTTPLGGSGTAILSSVVQPTMTLSYIIKVTPDTSSSVATGVTSLGGMVGDIACGSGLICTGNIIDAVPAAGSITGPGLSTDNAIVRWNGIGGNAVQNSTVIIDDIGNTTTTVSTNTSLSTSIVNSNAGTTALSVFSLSNGTSIGGLVMGGTGYTAIAAFQNSLMISVPTAANGLGIYQTGDKPTIIYRSGTEIGRFPVSGGNILNLGTNASGLGGALGLYGSSSGLASVICPATCGTPVISLPILTSNLATLALTETFTNKTLTSPTVNAPIINTGTLNGTTTLGIRNTAAAFDLLLASTDGAMSANRTVTFNTQNGNRTIDLAGNITISGAFTTSGSSGLLTQTYTGTPTVAFGAGGTVVYDTVTQTLTNKTLTSPAINTPTITGAVLAAGSTSVAPLTYTSGSLLTSPAAGATEYLTNVFYSTPNTSNRGVSPSVHFLSLSANQNGTDTASAQTWFPGGGATTITLPASTTYLFEGLLAFSKSAGTTSHTIGMLFGGSATITSIAWDVMATAADSTAFTTLTTHQRSFVQVATNTGVWLTPSTNADQIFYASVKGIVRINGAGTFIPQFQYSAAPGGAPNIKANSYFKMWPAGTNTVLFVGNWS